VSVRGETVSVRGETVSVRGETVSEERLCQRRDCVRGETVSRTHLTLRVTRAASLACLSCCSAEKM
jgi:hypothetical protein